MGAQKPLTTHTEVIQIKDAADHIENVLESHHGPLIRGNDLFPIYFSNDSPDADQQHYLAYSSMALKGKLSFRGFIDLLKSQSWDEFRDVASSMHINPFNILYADSTGNIGYQLVGSIPIRNSRENVEKGIPMDGWTGENEWTGSIPFEYMPSSLNPDRGFLVSSNNAPFDGRLGLQTQGGFYYGKSWPTSYRAQRIEELLQQAIESTQKKVTTDDMRRIQSDVKSIPAHAFMKAVEPALGRFMQTNKNATFTEMAKRMTNWDGYLRVESVDGAIAMVVRRAIVQRLLHHDLERTIKDTAGFNVQDLYEYTIGKGTLPIRAATEWLRHDAHTAIQRWGTLDQKIADQIVEDSFLDALAFFKAQGVDDKIGSAWRWGRLHKCGFPHGLGRGGRLLEVIFSRVGYELAGGACTVAQAAWLPQDPFHNVLWSPSIRFVIDFDDPQHKSTLMIPPGTSGVLGSGFYEHNIPLLLSNEQRKIKFSGDTAQTILLQPE
eukprot:TRINITY_DN6543_c0_g2_i1.p1 TRINITY_DN6543_c0_g2~~TRINITY_DN6543_c0_g2_i1.p1  ORF type:complete len:532 (+),score=78.98 TRINITY_DN6543_c0_g2_i1:121-1596(+)